MTPRRWWLGVAVLTCAVLAHAAFPRYDWRPVTGQPTVLIRVDRWTGTATWGRIEPSTGRWAPIR